MTTCDDLRRGIRVKHREKWLTRTGTVAAVRSDGTVQVAWDDGVWTHVPAHELTINEEYWTWRKKIGRL